MYRFTYIFDIKLPQLGWDAIKIKQSANTYVYK